MARDAAFLKQARDRFKLAEEADKAQRLREIEDLRFYAGEQWDDDIVRSRQGQTIGSGSTQQVIPARPTLTINKTREPVRQVLNQERQSDMTIELIPADDWGEMTGPIDHTEIELREGLVRRIQRDSEASDARTWAFSRATIAGRGYWRINCRFVPGKTWDQEIYVERIYNQASVLIDPAHEQPDGSDAEWGFIGADLPLDEYKSKYPKAKGRPNRISRVQTDAEWRALGDEAPDWFTGEGKEKAVRVVTYYFLERTTRSLVLLTDGRSVWADELPDGFDEALIEDRRSVEQKQWKWADLDGVQVLDENDWAGHYLPIIKTLGEELQPYDKERRAEGIVRPMMGACKGNNYIVSKFVERVGLTPISPWMMATGQDEGYEDEYNAANTRALSRLHYNLVDSFGKPAPPPFRTDARAEIQDIGMGLSLFNQAIQSTSMTPETALGTVDPSVKSGKLARALIEQAERGNSNYLDNLRRSMRHEARVINDLLYPIYGRPGRLARMMTPNGEMSAVIIGQPFTMQGQGRSAMPQPIQAQPGQPMPQEAKHYALTPDAEFNVAVKISKSEGTRREQEVQTLGEIISADPAQMGIIGDLFFKYQDGPGHEEMSERYKAVLVPPVQALVSGKPNVPPEVQQQMAQMQEEMQKLKEDADKNRASLLKAQMDNQAKLQQTEMELKSKERLAMVEQLGQLAAVDAKLDAENARTFVDALENKIGRELELHMAKLDQVHQAITQHTDLAHEAVQSELDRQHEREMADVGHQQALEQMAAAPTPTTGASA